MRTARYTKLLLSGVHVLVPDVDGNRCSLPLVLPAYDGPSRQDVAQVHRHVWQSNYARLLHEPHGTGFHVSVQ
uniref:Putative secreted protein n=1 Tax=Anopheles marajoara TaxID=58244 RepID=A0A2M4CDV8_9DIPT